MMAPLQSHRNQEILLFHSKLLLLSSFHFDFYYCYCFSGIVLIDFELDSTEEFEKFQIDFVVVLVVAVSFRTSDPNVFAGPYQALFSSSSACMDSQKKRPATTGSLCSQARRRRRDIRRLRTAVSASAFRSAD